jgi:hypothetical protein
MPRRDQYEHDVIHGLQREVRDLKRRLAASNPYTSIVTYDPRNPPPRLIENALYWHLTMQKVVIAKNGVLRRTDETDTPSGSMMATEDITIPSGPGEGLEFDPGDNFYQMFNDSTLTAVEDGRYLVSANWEFSVPVLEDGIGGGEILKNDLDTVCRVTRYLPSDKGPIAITMTAQVNLAVGEKVSLVVFHDLTQDLDVVATDYSPVVEMTKIGVTAVTEPLLFGSSPELYPGE